MPTGSNKHLLTPISQAGVGDDKQNFIALRCQLELHFGRATAPSVSEQTWWIALRDDSCEAVATLHRLEPLWNWLLMRS